ncbi:hypothetical protein OMK64_05945 [Cellulomonas fimi]|uniref:hypothetical protein n=1 Tax=Cellulomonas fimi TaxID=1708 RepID=UPI00234CBE28|nr:hypothetical protein [Cellulomonas fimi]MDC7121074.1 hypothetical protein [Cellulomonas fimi]
MRTLSDVELRVLDRLLSIDFPRAAELRRQVEHITGVEPNCTCGCPSITPHVDRASAPPAPPGRSMLPVDLLEVGRTDGTPRTVICFVDQDGYLSNLECVYSDDDARDEWPVPEQCAVLVGGDEPGEVAVGLPGGAVVRPQKHGDRWIRCDLSAPGCVGTTISGFRETFAPDGTLVSRRRARTWLGRDRAP